MLRVAVYAFAFAFASAFFLPFPCFCFLSLFRLEFGGCVNFVAFFCYDRGRRYQPQYYLQIRQPLAVPQPMDVASHKASAGDGGSGGRGGRGGRGREGSLAKNGLL